MPKPVSGGVDNVLVSLLPHGMCGTSQIKDYFHVGWNKDHLNHDFTEVMESNHAVKNMIYVMDHITSQDVPVYVLFGGCQWLLIFPMKVFFSAGGGGWGSVVWEAVVHVAVVICFEKWCDFLIFIITWAHLKICKFSSFLTRGVVTKRRVLTFVFRGLTN